MTINLWIYVLELRNMKWWWICCMKLTWKTLQQHSLTSQDTWLSHLPCLNRTEQNLNYLAKLNSPQHCHFFFLLYYYTTNAFCRCWLWNCWGEVGSPITCMDLTWWNEYQGNFIFLSLLLLLNGDDIIWMNILMLS
jgi:hypothetical protein